MKNLNLEIKVMAEMREYDTMDLIDGRDETLLESFTNDYNSGYVSDIFNEISDNGVEIYNKQLRENSVYLEEYIEEALNNGFDTSNLDLIKLFMAGEFWYNSRVLYDNLDELIFNKLIQILKNDTESILESVSEEFENINNGDLFTVIINNDDIKNIIDENNIDDDDLLENFEDYIRCYIIEKIENREIGENSKGANSYIPFEIESYNKLKKFCRDAELREPTKNQNGNVFYITDDVKNTFEVLRASDVENKED